MTDTEAMLELRLGMCNLDYSIDKGFEEALRADPNKVFGRHAGWHFNGEVWFDGQQFVEEVWVFGASQKIVKADSLAELMKVVSDEFGYE